MENIILYMKVWAHKVTEPLIDNLAAVGRNKISPMRKRRIVADYADKFHCNVLVETGTYLGEMIEYQAPNFEKIYSVEIADVFYRFSSTRLRKKKNIRILKGDSGIVLKKIVRHLKESDKVLFWLDGHYSGGQTGMGEKQCPIYEELDGIFSSRRSGDVILIDDARCFDGCGNGYPSLEELKRFITNRLGNIQIEVRDDIVRVIVPRNEEK